LDEEKNMLGFEGVNPKIIQLCVFYVYENTIREYRELRNTFLLPNGFRFLQFMGQFGQTVP